MWALRNTGTSTTPVTTQAQGASRSRGRSLRRSRAAARRALQALLSPQSCTEEYPLRRRVRLRECASSAGSCISAVPAQMWACPTACGAGKSQSKTWPSIVRCAQCDHESVDASLIGAFNGTARRRRRRVRAHICTRTDDCAAAAAAAAAAVCFESTDSASLRHVLRARRRWWTTVSWRTSSRC